MLRCSPQSQAYHAEHKSSALVVVSVLLACLAFALFPHSAAADKGDLGQVQEAIKQRDLHWTAEAYDRTFPLGLVRDADTASLDANLPRITEALGLPSAIDWRDNGGNYVSPPKDQESCGSCWAFAPIAELEARYCIAVNTPGYFLDLSEQMLVSCVSVHYGCGGGDPVAAAQFLKTRGAPSEQCFPYTAYDEDCASACSNWEEQAYRILSYAYVDNTVGALKTALLDGPIQVAMNVYSDFYYYRSGVYEYAYGSDMGGHAILAVGYVDTPGQYGGGYFIAKNSWGPGWGDGGFFKVGYSQVTGRVAFGHLAHAYTVEVPTPDTYEPDNTSTDAKAISLDEKQTRNILPVGDQDWAFFALASPTTVLMETSGMPGGDTTLWLYDPATSLTEPIAQDEDCGVSQYSQIIRSLQPGTYYIRVAEHRPGAVISMYSLELSSVAWIDLPPALWLQGFGRGAGGWSSQDQYPRMMGDVNGDGLSDIVGFGNSGTYVSLSTGSGFAPATRWIAAYGYSAGGWTSQNVYLRMVGDVNGDGLADIVGFGKYGTYVSLSTGSAFGASSRWIASYGYSAGGWTSQDKYPRMLADVNGDGKADVVGFGAGGTYVSLSTGSSFASAQLWIRAFGVNAGGWISQDQYPRIVADVTGDGKADVIGFGKAGAYMAPSSGTSFAPSALWLRDLCTSQGWSSQDLYPRTVADFDGDGKADIIGYKDAGVYVALSSGSGFGASALQKCFFGTADGWTSYDLYPRTAADLNSDRKADLIGFGQKGVFVSLVP